MQTIFASIQDGSQVACIFMDFCKAFDRISRSILSLEIKHPVFVVCMKSYYLDRIKIVKIENSNFSHIEATSGLP